ncbi:MAG TPA: methylmalonyl-CoA mutase family protein [Caulobacterales bacterium]|nr:methylmalonyl-CoA mutase family protein [Caulobacterales bacterium]
MSENLPLADQSADEGVWRALVEKSLKGARWERLVSRTAEGLEIKPLYRETDFATSTDVSGFPGAAPFVRGARTNGPWLVRQSYDHPDLEHTNRDILADLQGGVGAIELVVDPAGARGIAVKDARDLDRALADVIIEAAPVSLDAGAHATDIAPLLIAKLKGVAAPGTALNIDLLAQPDTHRAAALDLAIAASQAHPHLSALRIDARPFHESGGGETQEIAAALATGVWYLRLLTERGMAADDAARILRFSLAVGADVLVEAAKLRALRLCWARVTEAFAVAPENRAAHIHAFTSRRTLTRYDAWTNILRVTTSAFAAAIGGADEITTLPFTDALGVATPFARRLARNTQNVLLEEAHLAHVADPAGGAWFAEALTRELSHAAWSIMQALEAQGGILAALQIGEFQTDIATARDARMTAFATRKETITGVTDFPLLGESAPEVARPRAEPLPYHGLAPIRWAEPFEALRGRAERITPRPAVFFANLGALSEFGPRANFARNLLAVGGIAGIGAEMEYVSGNALLAAYKASGALVAIICGTDARYGDNMALTAEALRDAGCRHIILAGEPRGTDLIQQFVWSGCDAIGALRSLHAALGVA